MQAYLSCILLIASALAVCSAVQIKVGIYNNIPGLDNDGLQAAYKEMIENDFKQYCQENNIADCSVNAVVQPSAYNPYSGSLADYLDPKKQGFDILEIDIGYTLGKLVDGDHIISIDEIDKELIQHIEDTMFPSAVRAVTFKHVLTHKQTVYALPTLLCGNFITSIDPATQQTCPIYLQPPRTFEEYKKALDICWNNVNQQYESLIMGKMYNGKGSYLPDIYLDGYIDIHGEDSLDTAILELLLGVVDETLCERLQWFVGLCKTKLTDENKCNGRLVTGDFDQATYDGIIQNKNLLMFSFSEKLSTLLQKAGSSKQPHALASVSFGDKNNLLQYVDGLVTGKEQWKKADSGKKKVISAFNRFFIQTKLRERVTKGDYLTPQANTYLIIPNKKFYSSANIDPIYKQMLPFLNSAVPAPYISTHDRKKMLDTLKDKCVPGLFKDQQQGNKMEEKKIEL